MCEDMLKLGPDVVELVMTAEEKFAITIPDEDAEKILTMGQLYDYVFARVARGQGQVCYTSATFYRLRRALGEVCHVPRERVRPQAPLEDLIPVAERRRYWRELQDRLGDFQLPRLRRPAWMVNRIETVCFITFFLAMFCGGVLAILLFAVLGDTQTARAGAMIVVLAGIFMSIPASFLMCRALCRRTEHLAVHIPPSCVTVRDLVYTLVSSHRAPRMVSDTERANDKEIWGTLSVSAGTALDRPSDSFTRESTFV